MPATATAVTVSPRRPAVLPVVVRFVSRLVSTFEGDTAARLAAFFRSLAAAHLGALLLEDGLPRQLNAVAFDGQHLDQDLVAFFQFIANIIYAMLGNLADV